MNTRGLPLLIFPILGMALALMFRPSERSWATLEKPERVRLEKKTLHVPDGQGIRFIHVPNSTFALSVTEIPPSLLEMYANETRSHAGATAFALWLSRKTGESIRLPRAEEWRQAARGGIPNTEFVWGFGLPNPPKGLNFALKNPNPQPGPGFGYGFRDMAGGLWEWTEEGLLLGSAWAERDPQTLYIDHVFRPPESYAGEDTGIRLLWEKK